MKNQEKAKHKSSQRHTLAICPNHSYCDVCEYDNKRNALLIDGVRICSECVVFLKNLAEVSSRTQWEEIFHQVNYIKVDYGNKIIKGINNENIKNRTKHICENKRESK